MTLELDHVFICVAEGGPEAETLDRCGLIRGSGRRHEGQGTCNVSYFFHNAYLELIWVDAPDDARSPTSRATGLWERSRWRYTGASPFGIALRSATSASSAPPFDTWSYRPAYLPAGMVIPIAANSAILSEPLLFVVPGAVPPSTYSAERREPLDHPGGFCRITGLKITVCTPQELSPEIQCLRELGIAEPRSGQAAHLEVAFDGGRRGEAIHFEPLLPLSFGG